MFLGASVVSFVQGKGACQLSILPDGKMRRQETVSRVRTTSYTHGIDSYAAKMPGPGPPTPAPANPKIGQVLCVKENTPNTPIQPINSKQNGRRRPVKGAIGF